MPLTPVSSPSIDERLFIGARLQSRDVCNQTLARWKEARGVQPSIAPASRDAVIGDIWLAMVRGVRLDTKDDAAALQPANE
jgi:hypothetical protein